MPYSVTISEDVRDFLSTLDKKSNRIVKENLSQLEHPYPGRGHGDKERLPIEGEKLYRLHIGRTWTVFYDIDESEEVVRVLDILPIDEAHEKYGY